MELTEKDYRRLADDAGGYCDAGFCSVYLETDEDNFSVDFEIETEGYREDDYFNGTGGSIVTDARCYVKRTDIPRFDADRFERMVEKNLIT